MDDVPVRRLSHEWRWTRGSVLARTQGPEGGGLGGPTSIGEKGTSVGEDAEPRKEGGL